MTIAYVSRSKFFLSYSLNDFMVVTFVKIAYTPKMVVAINKIIWMMFDVTKTKYVEMPIHEI